MSAAAGRQIFRWHHRRSRLRSMADNAPPTFLVDATSDPIVIRVCGRASFLNAGTLSEFVTQQIGRGKLRFVFDFKDCTSMDSTFLGTVAGAGLKLRRNSPQGSLVLARLSQRNLDLIRNLGLHRICLVDTGSGPLEVTEAKPTTPLRSDPRSEIENARLVLAAHENLLATDEANLSKFQDVITLLRKRVDEG